MSADLPRSPLARALGELPQIRPSDLPKLDAREQIGWAVRYMRERYGEATSGMRAWSGFLPGAGEHSSPGSYHLNPPRPNRSKEPAMTPQKPPYNPYRDGGENRVAGTDGTAMYAAGPYAPPHDPRTPTLSGAMLDGLIARGFVAGKQAGLAEGRELTQGAMAEAFDQAWAVGRTAMLDEIGARFGQRMHVLHELAQNGDEDDAQAGEVLDALAEALGYLIDEWNGLASALGAAEGPAVIDVAGHRADVSRSRQIIDALRRAWLGDLGPTTGAPEPEPERSIDEHLGIGPTGRKIPVGGEAPVPHGTGRPILHDEPQA